MSLIARELRDVWDALRATNGHRGDALTEVRIRKLLGIRDLRLPLGYPVSVLAGPNGCGKSTVLFACASAYKEALEDVVRVYARFPGADDRDLAGARFGGVDRVVDFFAAG